MGFENISGALQHAFVIFSYKYDTFYDFYNFFLRQYLWTFKSFDELKIVQKLQYLQIIIWWKNDRIYSLKTSFQMNQIQIIQTNKNFAKKLSESSDSSEEDNKLFVQFEA